MRLNKIPSQEYEWTITLTQKERDSLERFLHLNSGNINVTRDEDRQVVMDFYSAIEGRNHTDTNCCPVCRLNYRSPSAS